MKIVVRSTLPPNPTTLDIFNLLLKSRLDNGKLKIENWDFLSPPHPSSLSLADFGFDQAYVAQAMELVWRCHPEHPDNPNPHRPIVVYTDYDADGVTGGAILWETLHTLGFKAFPYTPNRVTEGYGFSAQGLDFVKQKYNPALIISVDHGITAHTLVSYALEKLEIPIIITDHHHKQEEKVPKVAKAIFHIPALSGSGVAYYVGKEIVNSTKYRVQSTKPEDLALSIQHLELQFRSDYVGIAAIGTIADLVPLQGPSRSIAFHGLKVLTNTQRPGLVALKKVADHIGKTVTTYEVSFLLAPRINASGRLEDALDALRLLCTKDVAKAHTLAQKINILNVKRQDMVKKAVEEALVIVESQKDTVGNLPKILIIHQPNNHRNLQPSTFNLQPSFWHEGIIGLIASKICEKYHRPTVVFTSAEATPSPPEYSGVPSQGKEGKYIISENPSLGRGDPPSFDKLRMTRRVEGVLKASCRSITGFHMTNYLTALKDALIKFGGHEMAAGFSIESEKLEEFTMLSQKYADTHITDEMLERTITVDCELPLKHASIEFAEMLEKMAPFGMGNPKPVFLTKGKIVNIARMGKDGKHARFRLVHDTEGLDCVAFNKAEEIISQSTNADEVQIVYNLDINRWNGSEKVQGKVVDLLDDSRLSYYRH